MIADNEATGDSYQQVLRREGNRVKVAASPAEGMARLDEDSFQLVIFDAKSPGTDGIGILTQIRARYPGVSVALAGARVSGESAVPGMDALACDFILKPFTPDSLKFVVELALEKRRCTQDEIATRVPSLEGERFLR